MTFIATVKFDALTEEDASKELMKLDSARVLAIEEDEELEDDDEEETNEDEDE